MAGPAPSPARQWVGVLGGSFDPVHLGHVRLATSVQQTFCLSRVLLVPCAVPPHKPDAVLCAARHRLAMLRLAIGDRPGLEVSTLELDRGGISYTIDTLRALAREGLAPLFILGMDSLAEIHGWRDERALLREFDLVAVDRPSTGADRPPLNESLAARLVRVPGRPGAGAGVLAGRRPGGGLFRLLVEPTPVSSSGIRRRARNRESLDGLVPPAVARYIQDEGLYREEDCR